MRRANAIENETRAERRARINEIDLRIRNLELTCFRRARTAFGCTRYGLSASRSIQTAGMRVVK